MKLITFTQGTDPRCGLALSDTIGIDLQKADPTLPFNWHAMLPDLSDVRRVWDEQSGQLEAMTAMQAAGNPLPSPFIDLMQARVLAPIILPSKIIAVGLNYRDHAEEQNKKLPEKPMLFSKASTCLQSDGGPIELAEDLTQVDAEAEIAVVIGRPGRAIARENARDHIAGYTCFNDVSDRDAQYSDRQYFRGKSIDTGGPCGPWIVTPDELPDLAHGLAITCKWNGELMQSSNTDQLIFPIDHLISYISRNITLLAGDIITTGTPGGVGVFRDPKVFLKPGDRVEVTIEGIGTLTNPVTRWEHPGG
jgi:2-keto-4-pentenoate hydratase/2-oxohepta-3-ene-1,7-dioic acid hydratase in catechol pathway